MKLFAATLSILIAFTALGSTVFSGVSRSVRNRSPSLIATAPSPPTRSNGSPSGAQPSGTTQVTLSLTTDENATCKWDTASGTAYASMANTFSTTGTTSHSTTASGLSDGNSYTDYVRCIDGSGNANTDDFSISYSVDSAGASAPYDLGTLPAIVADVQWPTPPTTNSTVTVCASGCDLTEIPWTTNDQRVEVSSGSYAGGIVSCTNCQFVGTTGATVTTPLELRGSFIEFSVWWTTNTMDITRNVTDILLSNVHVDSTTAGSTSYNIWSGTAIDGVPWERIALVNTTIECSGPGTPGTHCDASGGWAMFMQAEAAPDGVLRTGRDLILANTRFESNGQNHRFQSVENLVIVDSAFNLDNTSTNGLRLHHGMQDVYIRDTIMTGINVGSASSTLDVTDIIIDNVTRYVSSKGTAFATSGGTFTKQAGVCTIDNSEVHPSGGTLTGSVPLAGTCTGTNPNVDAFTWNGLASGLPNPDGTGRPAPNAGIPYGADH